MVMITCAGLLRGDPAVPFYWMHHLVQAERRTAQLQGHNPFWISSPTGPCQNLLFETAYRTG